MSAYRRIAEELYNRLTSFTSHHTTSNTMSNTLAWATHTTPFIANAPMFGFADVNLATAVTKAGGFGMPLTQPNQPI